MTEEINGVAGSRKKEPQDLQQMHQAHLQHIQKLTAARQAAAPAATGPEAAAPPRLGGDRNGTGRLIDHSLQAELAEVDLGRIQVAPVPLAGVGAAIAELGVVAAMGQVAAAFTRTTFDPQNLAASLEGFTTQMTAVADQLNKLPGVGDALQVFGGVGGIVTGVNGLREQLQDVKANGVNKTNALGAASAAARLVGGVAMALAPLCAPLAGIGGSIMLAGAALELGKLGLENRGALKAGTAKLAEGLNKVVSNNGAAAVESPVRIVGNNGANMVREAQGPWGWLGA